LHPIDDFPPGTSHLIAAICDLFKRAGARTGRDKRSVGELLVESDHTVRAILMDGDEMDAAMTLRTCGDVVQAAGDLWQALPPATPPQQLTGEHLPDSADLAIQQLSAMSEAMHRTGHGRAWPGDVRINPKASRQRRTDRRATTARASRAIDGS
jgi:hypothetical protein